MLKLSCKNWHGSHLWTYFLATLFDPVCDFVLFYYDYYYYYYYYNYYYYYYYYYKSWGVGEKPVPSEGLACVAFLREGEDFWQQRGVVEIFPKDCGGKALNDFERLRSLHRDACLQISSLQQKCLWCLENHPRKTFVFPSPRDGAWWGWSNSHCVKAPWFL